MTISRSPKYKNNLFQILDYIAQDKFSASEKFKIELDELIDNEDIRDMVYKGYTVIYRINLDKNIIDIVRIFNKNKPPLDLRHNKP